jgi:hypothetical protein
MCTESDRRCRTDPDKTCSAAQHSSTVQHGGGAGQALSRNRAHDLCAAKVGRTYAHVVCRMGPATEMATPHPLHWGSLRTAAALRCPLLSPLPRATRAPGAGADSATGEAQPGHWGTAAACAARSLKSRGSGSGGGGTGRRTGVRNGFRVPQLHGGGGGFEQRCRLLLHRRSGRRAVASSRVHPQNGVHIASSDVQDGL